MESAIWLILYIAVFAGLVIGGFWVIARASLPQWVAWVFGAIVLVVIIFALIYIARGYGPPFDVPPHRRVIVD